MNDRLKTVLELREIRRSLDAGHGDMDTILTRLRFDLSNLLTESTLVGQRLARVRQLLPPEQVEPWLARLKIPPDNVRLAERIYSNVAWGKPIGVDVLQHIFGDYQREGGKSNG